MIEKKYNYVYRIINSLNGMEYIGVHSTDNIDDKYFGSGTYLRNAIQKYGIKNFTKEIIQYFDCRELALTKEKEIVSEDFVKRCSVYNLVLGGGTPKNRILSIKKFKRGEEKQKFINFDNPIIEEDYTPDIPIDERKVFVGNKKEMLKLLAPGMSRYFYYTMRKEQGFEFNKTEKQQYLSLALRYEFSMILADNINRLADSLTRCYNNKTHRKVALKALNDLYSRGMLGTAIEVEGYKVA
jgi:hypothetical protein